MNALPHAFGSSERLPSPWLAVSLGDEQDDDEVKEYDMDHRKLEDDVATAATKAPVSMPVSWFDAFAANLLRTWLPRTERALRASLFLIPVCVLAFGGYLDSSVANKSSLCTW